MRRARNRDRSHKYHGAEAAAKHPIRDAFEFLAECHYEKGGQIGDSEWRPQEFELPFSEDDSEVTLSDYYDDCHYGLMFQMPKTLSYQRLDSEENGIKAKIETLLTNMCNKDTSDSTCRLEIDLIKVLLALPDNFNAENSLTIARLKESMKEKTVNDRVKSSSIRVYLPSGPDALIGVLEDLGAKLRNKGKKKDTLRCSCFFKNFKYKNRSFESSLFIDPENLTFCDWESIEYPAGSMCLANPRSTSDDGDEEGFLFDLRIKAKAKIEHTKEDFLELWINLQKTPPPALTEPGLDGLIRRDGDGYACKPNAHIDDVLEKTNKTVYHFEMEGFEVILATTDGREFHIDRSTGRCDVRYSYECWPKLLFILDNKDRIPELIDLAYRCVVALFEALSENRLEVRPWRCFGNLPGGVNVPCVDLQMLRRIKESVRLDDMLGVSGQQNRRVLSNRLQEVLEQMDNMPVVRVRGLDPAELKRKLIDAGRERGIQVR